MKQSSQHWNDYNLQSYEENHVGTIESYKMILFDKIIVLKISFFALRFPDMNSPGLPDQKNKHWQQEGKFQIP